MITANEIADEIYSNAAALEWEVNTLATAFAKTSFFGDNRHFPHAHYGYLMACMGQIDIMSGCEAGNISSRGQTTRMQNFMERYLYPGKANEHRVAVKMMRHTLMHTGALRYIFDETTGVAYTWRIHFGGDFPTQFSHYSLTSEDATYQQDVISSVAQISSASVQAVEALNIQLTDFASDIKRVASAYTSKLRVDSNLQVLSEKVYPEVRVQRLT
ncbi:hypothetical protein OG308_15785 [Nocardia salmonicida]|uniref:Uncharacterized protein n=1 Tax=Nocardia salmonicida TaxID=53431 RepID=A0ABZ1NGU2_9NOCA